MKPWILLPLSICVAIPTQALMSDSGREPVAAARAPHSPRSGGIAERTAQLRKALVELRAENERLAAQVSEFRLASSVPVANQAVYDDDEIADAVARWLASNAIEERVLTQPIETPVAARRTAASDLSIEQLLEFFAERQGFDTESTLMYEELREAGRMDEFVARLEAMVEANPDDSELQTSLGLAYLQKLFGLGPSPEAGVVALQADRSFDRAIALDPRNTQARFTKAISLSNWPEFLGKTDEAIKHFEIVRAQFEEMSVQGATAQVYLFLGNMYKRIGEDEKAAATWRAGLAYNPKDEALAEQIDLMAPTEADPTREASPDTSKER